MFYRITLRDRCPHLSFYHSKRIEEYLKILSSRARQLTVVKREILDIKKRIRDIYGIGNHSVHMTDNTEETIQIANIILNKNSIHLLSYGCPDKYKQINGLIISILIVSNPSIS